MSKKFLIGCAFAGAMMMASGANAVPITSSLNVTYYTVSSGDHDFHVQSGYNYTYCTSTPGNSSGNGGCQVKPTIPLGTGLDANGKPLLGASGIQFNNPSAGEGIADIAAGAGGGQILTWWTVGGHVSANNLPANPATYVLGSGLRNMYPNGYPNGSDTSGWETAEFSGSIVSAGTYDFVFGLQSDDDSYIYLNGLLVAENPGVHDNSAVNLAVNGVVCPLGGCAIDVFYADRNTVNATFSLSVDATQVSVPTPEPATLALVGAGLLGMGRLRKRKAS